VTCRERQLVTRQHTEQRQALQRSVFTDWGRSGFGWMLTSTCQLAGKELLQVSERETSKTRSGCGHQQPMPLYKRVYRRGNGGLVMDRDENSAVTIRERFLARLGPHTAAAVRCRAGDQGDVTVTGAVQAGHVQESTRLNTF